MHKIIAFLIVVLFCTAAAAQEKPEKYTEDQKLIEQVAKERDEAKKQAEELKKEVEELKKQAETEKQIKKDEVRVLTDADQARLVPKDIEKNYISYPADWPKKVQKRAKYDGILAQGPPDENGKYVVIYDISDLIYEPPNFSFDEHQRQLSQPYQPRYYPYWNRNFYDPFDPLPFEREQVNSRSRAENADEIAELVRALLRCDDEDVQVVVPREKEQNQEGFRR